MRIQATRHSHCSLRADNLSQTQAKTDRHREAETDTDRTQTQKDTQRETHTDKDSCRQTPHRQITVMAIVPSPLLSFHFFIVSKSLQIWLLSKGAIIQLEVSAYVVCESKRGQLDRWRRLQGLYPDGRLSKPYHIIRCSVFQTDICTIVRYRATYHVHAYEIHTTALRGRSGQVFS